MLNKLDLLPPEERAARVSRSWRRWAGPGRCSGFPPPTARERCPDQAVMTRLEERRRAEAAARLEGEAGDEGGRAMFDKSREQLGGARRWGGPISAP